MLNFILIVFFGLLTLLGLMMKKTYNQTPPRELRRRAQKGDTLAQVLYRAVAYGSSLQVLLWIMIGVGATGLFFLVARDLPWPLALLGIVVLLAVGLIWLPHIRAGGISQRLTAWLTPAIAWKLSFLHPFFSRVGDTIHRSHHHTRLYEKDDLIELLEQQAKQTDNRIAKGQLDMSVHALTFGDKLVRDTLTPFSQVKTVNSADSLGPVLMGELHDDGHSRFPVYDGKKANLVGILYLRDLLQEHQGGLVKNIMHRHVTYVHEEQTLYQTLQAFLKTKRHLFIVVNRFEEVVGIITIEDVLEQIIGKPIMDEFDQYEDLRAVAARMAAKVHKEQKHETPEPAEADHAATPEPNEPTPAKKPQ